MMWSEAFYSKIFVAVGSS